MKAKAKRESLLMRDREAAKPWVDAAVRDLEAKLERAMERLADRTLEVCELKLDLAKYKARLDVITQALKASPKRLARGVRAVA
jgi:hypothetical protein